MKAFANYHPAVLLLYFLSVLLVGMFVTNPVIQLTMLLGAVLFCIMCTPSGRSAGASRFTCRCSFSSPSRTRCFRTTA